MKQQYFQNTLISKFIKYILSKTPIPMIPVINTDDIIIEGCTYIYKNNIYRCTKTGRFIGPNHTSLVEDHLYVNEYLLTTDKDYVMEHPRKDLDGNVVWDYFEDEKGIGGLTVTDDVVRYMKQPQAEVQLLGYYRFGEAFPNITCNFVSNKSYYDQKTHKWLGEYLRCLRGLYDLDLMSMYNCFNYDITNKIVLKTAHDAFLDKTKEVLEEENTQSTVLLIPIKFNKDYTIALDSSFPILMKAIIYDGVLLKTEDNIDLTTQLEEDTIRVNSITFHTPYHYKIMNTSKSLQEFESRLYLAIQVPKNLKSSVVILEGNYTNDTSKNVVSVDRLNSLSPTQLSEIFRSNPSLLESNDQKQYPFADKLISYLLRFTIDGRDYINENIEKIQDEINYKYEHPKYIKGIWNNDLRYSLYKGYLNIENRPNLNKNDILGFVDKDIEDAVSKGWIKYEQLP